MIPASVQHHLNKIAEEYGQRLLSQVKTVFEKYSNSGALVRSLKLEIKKATDKSAPVISLIYDEQGYFIGYKSPRWSKQPNITKLLEWGQHKTFKTIPGYKGDASNLPEFKKRERVAWAIAKDKLKNDTWKPKRWKKEANIGALLKDLNEDTILNGYKKEYQKILEQAIEGVTA